MKHYDIMIIGGGASGMMCAANICTKKSVAIVEAGYSLGKKILVTGNGRCNLTNVNMSSKFYNRNIENYLKQHNQDSSIKYFNFVGLDTVVDNEGRVYPFTNYARSVVDILNKQISNKKNIDIITNEKVINIDIIDKKYIVYGNNDKYECNTLIIATGNIANDFYKSLNIECVEKTPSLVSLKTKENTKNLDGIRISNVRLTAMCDNKKMVQEGEVLFKDNGLSGISVFNLSTLFARNKKYNGTVTIDLLPNRNDNQTCEIIKNRCKIFNRVVDIFDGLFVPAVREELFKRCKIDEQINSSKLTTKQIEDMSRVIHNLAFNVCGHYDNYQVLSGGVELNNLDNNLQSKRHRNLFFIGEVIDVDGECGGYNLQWAWTSGMIVSKAISN